MKLGNMRRLTSTPSDKEQFVTRWSAESTGLLRCKQSADAEEQGFSASTRAFDRSAKTRVAKDLEIRPSW
jgi:hypothetical protein